jgi:hypothetical protein
VWLCRQKTKVLINLEGQLMIRYEIEVEYISIPCKLKIRSNADFILITESEFLAKISAACL